MIATRSKPSKALNSMCSERSRLPGGCRAAGDRDRLRLEDASNQKGKNAQIAAIATAPVTRFKGKPTRTKSKYR